MDDSLLESKVDTLIRSRMARLVIPRDQREMDARTAFNLAQAGVLRKPLPDQMSDSVRIAIKDPHHISRKSLINEPLLVIDLDGDLPDLIELDVCLLNPNREVRSAILEELDRKFAASASICGAASQRVIRDQRQAAISDDGEAYRPACIAIYDVLVDDVLFNLSLLEQSCRLGIGDRIPLYMDRLLRPSMRGLDHLGTLTLLGNEVAGVDSGLSTSCSSFGGDEIEQFLTAYFKQFGFVPLTGAVGLGSALRKWQAMSGGHASWKDLRKWSNNCRSVLARYHICQAVTHSPELFLDSDCDDIDSVFREVFDLDGDGQSSAWSLRVELARYYCQHFTCEFPTADTGQTGIIAWWLADQVATAIESGTTECVEFCVDHLRDAADLARHLWILMPSSGKASVLYAATLHHRNLWSESLAGELAESLTRATTTILSPTTFSSFLHVVIGGSLVTHHSSEARDEATYSFELDTYPFISHLQDALTVSQREQFPEKILATENSFGRTMHCWMPSAACRNWMRAWL